MGAGIINYGLLGTRLTLENLGPAGAYLALTSGRGSAPDGGSWIDFSVGGDVARWFGKFATVGRAEFFGLSYSSLHRYRASGIAFRPNISRAFSGYTASVTFDFTRGGWEIDDPMRRSGPLSVTGAILSLGRPVGLFWVEGGLESFQARNGTEPGRYQGLTADVSFSSGSFSGGVDARWWSTPNDRELGYEGWVSFTMTADLVGWLTIGRTTTDPLYGSRGGFTARAGMNWRIASKDLRPAYPVVELAESVRGGRRVRFRLTAVKAEQVALAGDFTGWTPQPMRRSGDDWHLELILKPGVHHFGFLLDGDRWYIPKSAPGIIDDGWGRQNASVVVEGE